MNKCVETGKMELRRCRAGFTLLEVLVAMVILSMLILMIGNMFQQVSDSWNIGTQSAEANTAGRAALNFIGQELSQAVAGPIEPAPGAGAGNQHFMGLRIVNSNEIEFLSLAGDPSVSRALRGAAFWSDYNTLRYLRRTGATGPFNPYTVVSPLSGSGNTVISNVVNFKIFAYTNMNSLSEKGQDLVFSNQLPACVDLYLEVLTSDNMRRYQDINDPSDADDFLDRNVQSYATRVYFSNRRGYAAP